jgi:dolichol-phosphate mannosyltransferase
LTMDTVPALSIIIPVRDEKDAIPALAAELTAAMAATDLLWECIWVDDGSADATVEQVAALQREDARHRGLSMKRGGGKSVAVAAGFRQARGSILAMLDGDGQDDPADLPALVKMLVDENLDMVVGCRRKRQDNLVRRLSSRIANRFRNWLTNENISDAGCGVRVFRRECVLAMPLFEGMHRFLPTLARVQGFDCIAECPVNHRPRTTGKAKYGVRNRLWVGLADTFAICWMQRRLMQPTVLASVPIGPATSRDKNQTGGGRTETHTDKERLEN